MNEEQTTESTTENQFWEPDLAPVKKPVWPPILGGINIALGALGLLCGGIGMLSMSFFAGLVEDQLNGDPLPPNMMMTPYTLALSLFGMVLTIVLLIGAILLVMRRYKARMFMLIYAGLGLIVNFLAFLNQLNIQSATTQWAKDYPNNEIARSMDPSNNPGAMVGQMVGLGFFLLIGLGWPLFMLIWFGLVKTKAHQMTGLPEDEDEY